MKLTLAALALLLTTTAAHAQFMRLSWDGDPTATGHNLQRSANGDWVDIGSTAGRVYTDGPLAYGETYGWRVNAEKAISTTQTLVSAWSVPAWATVPRATVTPTPTPTPSPTATPTPSVAPVLLSAVPVDGGGVRITWEPVAGANYYYPWTGWTATPVEGTPTLVRQPWVLAPATEWVHETAKTGCNWYALTAVSGGVQSPKSNIVAAMLIEATPEPTPTPMVTPTGISGVWIWPDGTTTTLEMRATE